MFTKLVFILGMAVNGITDIKYKKIWKPIIAIMMICGLIIRLVEGNLISTETLCALIPGVGLFAVARLSKEAIGYGDCWMVLCAGLYMNVEEIMLWLLISCTFSGILGMVYLLILKKGKKYEIPMAPFLFGGYAIIAVLT